MPGGSDPLPGTMGRGYVFEPRTVALREVNILSRVGRDMCEVQDLYNANITKVNLAGVWTALEVWNYVAKHDATLLPRNMKLPETDRTKANYWRADRLPKSMVAKFVAE